VDRDQLPRWSPDSRQVIFTREPGAEAKLPIIPVRASPWSIWIADAESGEGHAVWHSGAADNDSYPQLTEEGSLNVSADGHIIFSSEQDGWNHLYSMPVAGGQPTLLTPGEFEVENVSMSADGRSVVFSSNQDDIDRRHIWRVSAAGGNR
jgi:Tol biopolymer transport system component